MPSPKAFIAVLGLVIGLCFAAPNAVADQFVYTYTIGPSGFGSTFTTEPMSAVTAETTILAGDLASFSLTGSFFQGKTLTSLVLDAGGIGDQHIISSTGNVGSADGFLLSEYATPGTYTSGISTLTVTDVTATPEPGSLALTLAAVGLVFTVRKRWSLGLPQTA